MHINKLLNKILLSLIVIFLSALNLYSFTGSLPEIQTIGNDQADSVTVISADSMKTEPDTPAIGSAGTPGTFTERTSANFLPKWHSAVTNLPGDIARWYGTEFTTEKIPYWVAISAMTAGLIVADDALWKKSTKFYKHKSVNKNWSDIFTEIGDGRTQFTFAALFGTYGYIGNDNRALRTASQIVEAVLASGGVVQVLKHITGRETPSASKTPGGIWRFFPNQTEYHKHVADYDAFPSGHVTTTIAAFIVIAENYPEYKWIAPFGYGLATFVAVGMVNKGIHWYSDYPLAVALGYAFGKLVANPAGEISNDSSESGEKLSCTVSPYLNYNGVAGLTCSLHF
ncbi:MAG: phosphatase PAP2 family protein [Ignavibacteria bacterium]